MVRGGFGGRCEKGRERKDRTRGTVVEETEETCYVELDHQEAQTRNAGFPEVM